MKKFLFFYGAMSILFGVFVSKIFWVEGFGGLTNSLMDLTVLPLIIFWMFSIFNKKGIKDHILVFLFSLVLFSSFIFWQSLESYNFSSPTFDQWRYVLTLTFILVNFLSFLLLKYIKEKFYDSYKIANITKLVFVFIPFIFLLPLYYHLLGR